MLKWVLIVLGLALVLGPVMWVMPSAAQSRQAKLRAKAAALGLEVRISEMPQLYRARVRQEDTVTGAVYRLRHPPRHQCSDWLVCREAIDAWQQEDLQRVPEAQRSVLQTLAAEFPADVRAVDQNPAGLGIYWCERGDEATVEKCLQLLKQLQVVSA